MKKTHITLIGAMIATLGLGAGVTVTKTYNKTAVERTANDSVKKETPVTSSVAKDKESNTVEENDINNEIATLSTDVKSTGESNTKNENVNKNNIKNENTSKDNTKKESVTINSGNTTNEKTETQNNNKSESNTSVNTNKEENSIYKAGVTKADIEKVYDKYCKNVGAMYSKFGSHFRQYGQLMFSGEEGDGDEKTVEQFYNMSDKTLNDLWSGLKTILSENEMKALTKEQNQWIKEKENIKEEATSILSAETNTQYTQAEATYKRAISLAKKYL